jgi:hypothetical protein
MGYPHAMSYTAPFVVKKDHGMMQGNHSALSNSGGASPTPILITTKARPRAHAAIKAAGVACQALPDGATIETGESDYEPDAVVNCGAPMADNATAAPNPTIVVEVLAPETATSDTGAKLVDYFQVPSVAHYVIVHATKRVITHHRRTADGIDTRIIVAGKLVMDPPGITITLEEIYDAG